MSVSAVYDCMIFLQAAANPARVHSTMRLVESGKVQLHVSQDVLAEVRDVLSRPRHREKFPALTPENVSEFLEYVARHSRLIDSVPDVYTVASDPKDSRYVNLAIAAGATHLVSWDRHLLGLMNLTTAEGADFRNRFPNLQVVNPEDFVAMVANS